MARDKHAKERLASSSDYLKHCENTPNDPSDAEGRERRREGYDRVVNEMGILVHFCRYPLGRKPMPQAMARQEHYLAHRLKLSAGMTVLDPGCGFGGPATEIAKFVNCKVVGLNINTYQLQKGAEIAKAQGIGEDVLEFKLGDFLNIPYTDNSFDAVYAIEATVHAPSLFLVYSEIYRVLKPGGRFGVHEQVMLSPAFDPTNSRHISLRNGMERGNGIPYLRTSDEAQDAMRKAGFVLEAAENMADHNDPQPWWYFCAGGTEYAQGWQDCGRVVRMTGPGRVAFDWMLRALELLRVVRKATAVMANEMIQGADCIAEAGRDKLFTPMFLMIGVKA